MIKPINFGLATAILFSLFTASVQAADNPILRYSFNEGGFNSNNQVADTTGKGFDAKPYGDVAYTDGKIGVRMAFDGSGDYLVVEDSFYNDQISSPTFAIALWLKPSSAASSEEYLLSKLNSTSGSGFAVSIDANGKVRGQVYLDTAGYVQLTSAKAISASSWTHVAFTYDGNEVQLLVNGVRAAKPVAAAGDSVVTATEKLTVGALSGAVVSNEFDGSLDEVYLWDGAPADLDQYASTYGEPNLVLYESFDSSFGTWVNATNSGPNGGVSGLEEADTVAAPFANGLAFQDGADTEKLYFDAAAMNLNFERGHVSLWYKPDYAPSLATSVTFLETDDVSGGAPGAGDGIWLYRRAKSSKSGRLQYRVQGEYTNSEEQEPEGLRAWQADTWHHVEFVWDVRASLGADKYMAYIIDGEVAGRRTGDWKMASGAVSRLYIGNNRHSDRFMQGVIDELKIYSQPQYDLSEYAGRIEAYRQLNAADGTWQTHETVYDSVDAAFPDTALQAADPITFYKVSSFAPVYAGTVPNAGTNTELAVNDELSYSVATNDFESLFFNIYSQTNAADVTITLSDLTGPGGSAVSAADMRLHVAKNWWQRSDTGTMIDPFFPVWVPEVLMYDDSANLKNDNYAEGEEVDYTWEYLPDFPIPPTASVATSLKQYTSKQFMVRLKLPSGLAPGAYTLTATVTDAAAGVSRALTMNVQVRDIELPVADKDFQIYFRTQYLRPCVYPDTPCIAKRDFIDTTNLAPGMDEQDYYRAELQDLFEHGFNGLNTYGSHPDYVDDIDTVFQQVYGAGAQPNNVFWNYVAIVENDWLFNSSIAAKVTNTWGAGKLAVIVSDEPVTSLQLEKHIHNSMGVHFNGGTTAAASYQHWNDCLVSPEPIRYNAATKQLPYCQHNVATGDVGNYVFREEPLGSGNYVWEKENGYLIQPDEYKLDYENLSAYNNSRFDTSGVRAVNKEKGDTKLRHEYFSQLLDDNGASKDVGRTQSYYWQSRSEDTRINRYFAGVHLFLTDLAGIFPNVYKHNNSTDPWDDLDNPSATKWQREQSTVYPTRQGPMATMEWEAMREGIDDYRYLQLWESLYDAILPINEPVATASRTTLEIGTTANGHIGLDDFRDGVSNVLAKADAYADLDTLRELVATEIEGLQALDTDLDGLPDVQELAAGSAPKGADSGADADSDNDGIDDGDEAQHGTDIFDADSDGDGLSDGDEVNLYNTDPTNRHSDADWLGDGLEVNTYFTDPLDADTDNDGLADSAEVYEHGTDPLSAYSDSDGLKDGYEVNSLGTDPADSDSDDDGWDDLSEGVARTDPNDPLDHP